MDKKTIQSSIMLTLTAFIWGVAFVAQSVGMDYVGPFTFNTVRSFLGGMVLIPCILLFSNNKKTSGTVAKQSINNKLLSGFYDKKLIIGGISCGVILFLASTLQQFGLIETTPGKAGFITALYILIVPLLGLFLKRRVSIKVWIGVGIAIIGMYFLCINEGFTIAKGDILLILCAIIFSGHILVIDHFSPFVDGVKMSCIQFLVCGVLGLPFMLIIEQPLIGDIINAWQPILYAGVLSCGVAYTLQIIGQKNMNPVIASLILSLESVFATVAGWLILGDTLSRREILGCMLVFAAIILAQLPERKNILAKFDS